MSREELRWPAPFASGPVGPDAPRTPSRASSTGHCDQPEPPAAIVVRLSWRCFPDLPALPNVANITNHTDIVRDVSRPLLDDSSRTPAGTSLEQQLRCACGRRETARSSSPGSCFPEKHPPGTSSAASGPRPFQSGFPEKRRVAPYPARRVSRAELQGGRPGQDQFIARKHQRLARRAATAVSRGNGSGEGPRSEEPAAGAARDIESGIANSQDVSAGFLGETRRHRMKVC